MLRTFDAPSIAPVQPSMHSGAFSRADKDLAGCSSCGQIVLHTPGSGTWAGTPQADPPGMAPVIQRLSTALSFDTARAITDRGFSAGICALHKFLAEYINPFRFNHLRLHYNEPPKLPTKLFKLCGEKPHK